MDLTFDTLAKASEQLGVVLLLVLNIIAIWRKWFVPYYLVDELRSRAERAEVDGRYWRDLSMQVLTTSTRTLSIAERTTDLLAAKKDPPA
jgi:hypothetical protein